MGAPPLCVFTQQITYTQEGFTVVRYTNESEGDRIAFIGNYLPRQCGIATFTTDLCEAIATEPRQNVHRGTRQRH